MASFAERDLGEPIASRILFKQGSDIPISLLIWQPYETDEAWVCPFQIMGHGDEEIHRSSGSDAIQALQQSFAGIRAHLGADLQKIYWIGADIPDAGLPRTVDWSFGRDMYDYLCDLMDRELLPFPGEYMRCKRYRTERIAVWKREKQAWRRSGLRPVPSPWQPRKRRVAK